MQSERIATTSRKPFGRRGFIPAIGKFGRIQRKQLHKCAGYADYRKAANDVGQRGRLTFCGVPRNPPSQECPLKLATQNRETTHLD